MVYYWEAKVSWGQCIHIFTTWSYAIRKLNKISNRSPHYFFHIFYTNQLFYSIFFVGVDKPFFYENLEESMLSRFLNMNTNLESNTTLREKIHNNLHILIWYSNSTVSNPDKEMCTIEKNIISSSYCSKMQFSKTKTCYKITWQITDLHGRECNFWHLS